MDADHLDIYGTNDAIQASFIEFSKRLKPNGQLFVKNGLPIKGITYGLEDDADYSAQNIKIQEGAYYFDFKTPTAQYKDFKFNLPGRHNLSNAIIALAMTAAYGIPLPQLASALASYKGVKRRFTRHIKTQDLVFIDDYAHHPTEIAAVYEALREMYPQERITAVFQPHLFSRTRDFAQEFADALSRFDEVILLDIYPARELPIEGVTSAWLLSLMLHNRKVLCTKAELAEKILNSDSKVVVTMGAGDIGEEVSHIKEVLTGAV
jgi:UDP-N-acetylmuramate--alanine ligase